MLTGKLKLEEKEMQLQQTSVQQPLMDVRPDHEKLRKMLVTNYKSFGVQTNKKLLLTETPTLTKQYRNTPSHNHCNDVL